MNYSPKPKTESLLSFYSTQAENIDECRFGLWMNVAVVGFTMIALLISRF